MQKFRISSIFTLRSPLHISEPGQNYWNPNKLEWASSNAGGGFPCTRTKRMPLATLAESADGNNQQQWNTSLAYIPGNSFRGALRRNPAKIVMDALQARKELGNLDLYHTLMSGAPSPVPGKAATVSESVEAGKHPFASVFGGGPKFIWSRFSVGNAFPVTKATLAAQLVPASLSNIAAIDRITAVVIESRVDDIMRGGSELPTFIKNPEAEIAAWIKRLGDSAARRDAAKANPELEDDSKKAGLAGVQCKEVIIPGVSLHAESILDTSFAGEAALGLVVLTMARFANLQRIGGCSRVGFGRFGFAVMARNGTGGDFPLLTSHDGVYAPNLANNTVATAVAAWEDFAKTITVSKLMEVYSLNESGKPAAA